MLFNCQVWKCWAWLVLRQETFSNVCCRMGWCGCCASSGTLNNRRIMTDRPIVVGCLCIRTFLSWQLICLFVNAPPDPAGISRSFGSKSGNETSQFELELHWWCLRMQADVKMSKSCLQGETMSAKRAVGLRSVRRWVSTRAASALLLR